MIALTSANGAATTPFVQVKQYDADPLGCCSPPLSRSPVSSSAGVIGAFVAAKPAGMSARDAALHAFTYYGLCAELAMRVSEGPGSFRSAFLDKLYTTTREKCDIPVRSSLGE